MTDLNVDLARFNMIEQQVRPWDVLDQRVLEIMARVPRENFAPERFRNLAFADVEIPIGHGQCMMAPKIEGRLLQALNIQAGESVLEVGTGSGYLAACLASLGGRVVTVELHEDLSRLAQQRIEQLKLSMTFRQGDAAQGWDLDGLFNAIAVTGSVPTLDDRFRRQLAPGGRMFVVVGEAPLMEALLVTRVGDNRFTTQSLFETELSALENVERPQRFVF